MKCRVFFVLLLYISNNVLASEHDRRCLASDDVIRVGYGDVANFLEKYRTRNVSLPDKVVLYVYCFENGRYKSIASEEEVERSGNNTFFLISDDSSLFCKKCFESLKPFVI